MLPSTGIREGKRGSLEWVLIQIQHGYKKKGCGPHQKIIECDNGDLLCA